jgi:hypothetical protein
MSIFGTGGGQTEKRFADITVGTGSGRHKNGSGVAKMYVTLQTNTTGGKPPSKKSLDELFCRACGLPYDDAAKRCFQEIEREQELVRLGLKKRRKYTN